MSYEAAIQHCTLSGIKAPQLLVHDKKDRSGSSCRRLKQERTCCAGDGGQFVVPLKSLMKCRSATRSALGDINKGDTVWKYGH